MRLDLYLAVSGTVRSRELAKSLICSGGVAVNGITVTKPAMEISDSDDVKITADMPKYVGRGGLKLEKALKCFSIELNGLVCMDIGASTGGFTDCMLQSGAEFVYAVDVGHDQLDEKLAADSRVKNMEGTNIRNVSRDDFLKRIQFVSADVSFISLTKVIPKISELLDDGGSAVLLIKPQFECGKSDIGKNGIVRSQKVHVRVMKEITACCEGNGMGVRGMDYSPIQGGDGNIEYLIYAVKGETGVIPDFQNVADYAHKNLNKEK